MRVLHADWFLDGGTVIVYTDEGDFYFNKKFDFGVEGHLYNGYPDKSEIVEDRAFEVLTALKYYNTQKFNRVLEMRNNLLQPSQIWALYYPDLIIHDPDGWDRKNFDFSYNIELISRGEFERRVCFSTCEGGFIFHKKCDACDGNGYTSQHAPHCNGNCEEWGCPYQVPCEKCKGSGVL